MSRTIELGRGPICLTAMLCLLTLACRRPHRPGADQEVARAGRLYDDGDYVGAVAGYEQAARLGRFPEAVLSFEKAEAMDPRYFTCGCRPMEHALFLEARAKAASSTTAGVEE